MVAKNYFRLHGVTFVLISWSFAVLAKEWEEYYLDVQPANTSWHLTAIRALPLRQYRMGGDRKVRIGIIGPEVAELIPEAVELIHKQPHERRTTLHKKDDGIPTVNEQALFMYGIGATKELSKRMNQLHDMIAVQTYQLKTLYGTINDFEKFLSKSTEVSAELKRKESAKRAELATVELEIAIERVAAEKEYLEKEKQAEIAQMHLTEKLNFERLAKEDEALRTRTKEAVLRKLEADQKSEANRLETAELLTNLQHEKNMALQKATEEMKIKTAQTIAEAHANIERANEDVRLRKLKAESEQRRERHVAVLNAVSHQLTVAIYAAAENPRRTFIFIAYIASLAIAFHTAREGAKLCRLLIESALGRPKLLRETSRQTFPRMLFLTFGNALFSVISRRRREDPTSQSCEEVFKDVVLPLDLKERILTFARSARKVHQHSAPHRHVLFYGPPGTGKTMVARKLAQCIGMDYALMSGGDVGPLGADAVTQIHSLFTWAKFSRKGVLLFIDEAEAFLANRSKAAMSESAHNALNALLYNTGGDKRDFMLVLATNRAEDLDAAVLDRCDETLMFPLPDTESRCQLIHQYFDKYIVKTRDEINTLADGACFKMLLQYLRKPTRPRIVVDDDVMDTTQLQYSAKVTDGFSGREIGKLMIALQSAIHSSYNGRLTRLDVAKILEGKLLEHKAKLAMRS